MKIKNKSFLTVILTLILGVTYLFQAEVEPSKGQLIEAEVIRVVDGDTFVANVEGREEKVRLILIDTPETVHPQKPVQPFGPEASAFTKKKLEKQKVQLELDVQERDRYGRILAYVYLRDGSMLNQELLKQGLAKVSVYQPNVKYVDRFREIEKEARLAEKGVWGETER